MSRTRSRSDFDNVVEPKRDSTLSRWNQTSGHSSGSRTGPAAVAGEPDALSPDAKIHALANVRREHNGKAGVAGIPLGHRG